MAHEMGSRAQGRVLRKKVDSVQEKRLGSRAENGKAASDLKLA
jgi:hypothetical protein